MTTSVNIITLATTSECCFGLLGNGSGASLPHSQPIGDLMLAGLRLDGHLDNSRSSFSAVVEAEHPKLAVAFHRIVSLSVFLY